VVTLFCPDMNTVEIGPIVSGERCTNFSESFLRSQQQFLTADLVDVVLDDLLVHEAVEFVEKVDHVDRETVDRDIVEIGDIAEENRRRIKLLRSNLQRTTL